MALEGRGLVYGVKLGHQEVELAFRLDLQLLEGNVEHLLPVAVVQA